MKRKTIKVPAKTPLQYLQLFNGLFELTTKELQILAAFVTLHLAVRRTGVMVNVFSSDMKKRVAKELKMSDFNHLNVYIKKLADKKVIKKVSGGYTINPLLIPNGESEVVFQLV